MTSLSKFTQASISIVIVVAALVYGKAFLIPLIFAFIFWILIRRMKETLNRIRVIDKYVPNWVKNIFLTVVIFSLIYVIGSIISSNITRMIGRYDIYQTNFTSLVYKINDTFGIELDVFLKNTDVRMLLSNLIHPVVTVLTSMVGNVFLVLIYMLFLFLEETNFNSKLRLVFTTEENHHRISEILRELEYSISDYLGVKTFVSFITGALSAIALLIIGVDAPVFWGLIIFLLNYVPTVGSLIATLFPVAFCLLQFPNLTPAVLTLIIVGSIQVVIGNVLEPKLVGNSMNLSALVTILALSLWGIIWGVTGMILSVPITVIMVIIFSKFEQTKGIAIMLSDKGELKG
ncbi:MAG TPA: AI-2E family transporter [Aequorivita sp.]|nr:AI-2E family transporter [Aequorivita sp.]